MLLAPLPDNLSSCFPFLSLLVLGAQPLKPAQHSAGGTPPQTAPKTDSTATHRTKRCACHEDAQCCLLGTLQRSTKSPFLSFLAAVHEFPPASWAKATSERSAAASWLRREPSSAISALIFPSSSATKPRHSLTTFWLAALANTSPKLETGELCECLEIYVHRSKTPSLYGLFTVDAFVDYRSSK